MSRSTRVPTKFSGSDQAIRLGWVTGLIEGEGCIIDRNGRPSVEVATTDKDVALRLHEWSGVGVVNGPYPGTNKEVWRWRVTKRDDAGELLERMLPLLCGRRAEKAATVIAAWRARPTKGTAPTCGKGHLLDEANLRVADGRRRCRKCDQARQREYRERKAQNGHGNE